MLQGKNQSKEINTFCYIDYEKPLDRQIIHKIYIHHVPLRNIYGRLKSKGLPFSTKHEFRV